MPTELTWQIALILIADGFLLAIGWRLANNMFDFLALMFAGRRSPPNA
jgi:hypothetical protein